MIWCESVRNDHRNSTRLRLLNSYGVPVDVKFLERFSYRHRKCRKWTPDWKLKHPVAGAFIIPYVVMMTFVGLPVFFLELIIGQYAAAGPLNIWNISPLFRGNNSPYVKNSIRQVLTLAAKVPSSQVEIL